MMPLAEIEPWLLGLLAHGMLIFLRLGAVFFLLPIFGSSSVPMRVRLILVLGCVVLLLPLLPDPAAGARSRAEYVAAAGAELLTGLLLGFACRGLFWTMQLAGVMAAQAIALSQILGNQIEQPQAAFAQMLFVAALALAALLDFHLLILLALVKSYDLVPLGSLISRPLLEFWSVTALSRLFEIAFSLAAPFLILAILYNLCLGVVNKAMPQLMVAFVGAPAITWAGMAFLLLAAPVMLMRWSEHLRNLVLVTGLP